MNITEKEQAVLILMKNILMKLKRLFCLCVVRCSCFFCFHNWKHLSSKPMKTLKNSTIEYEKCKNCGCERDYIIIW
jgi:hypothetical protein